MIIFFSLQELFHRSNRKEFAFLFSHIFKYLLLYSRKSEEEFQEALYKVGTSHVQFGINYETWNIILNLLLVCIAEVAMELPVNVWDDVTRDSWFAFFSASFNACAEKCTKSVDISELRARRKRIEKTRGDTFSSSTSGVSGASDGMTDFISIKGGPSESNGVFSDTNSVASISRSSTSTTIISHQLVKVSSKSPYLGSLAPDPKCSFLTSSNQVITVSPSPIIIPSM